MNALQRALTADYHRRWWMKFNGLTVCVERLASDQAWRSAGRSNWDDIQFAVADLARLEHEWRLFGLPRPELMAHEMAMADAACLLWWGCINHNHDEYRRRHTHFLWTCKAYCEREVAKEAT